MVAAWQVVANANLPVRSPWADPRLLWTTEVKPWEVTLPDLYNRPGVDVVIDTRRWWQQRRDALSAHRTQRHGIERLFLGRANLEEILSVEVFRQAFGPPLPRRPVDDIFDGIAAG